MKDRNFLAELLMQNVKKPMAQPLGSNPLAQAVMGQQPENTPQAQPLATQQSFTPISVLDSRQALANSLLEQSSNRSAHPIARGIAAYFGSKATQDINAERTRTEEAIAKREEEKEAEKMRIEQERFDRTIGLQERQLEQSAKQFEQTLALRRQEFNARQQRDANNNAVMKIRDEERGVDLLFKGNAPVTDGLEKGLQWATDDEGNRVAVPIPTQPTQKAAIFRDLTLETVDRLLANEAGVKGNFGAADKFLPNMRESTMQAQTDLNQLRSLLTVENLDLMTGVLSETDIKILQNVAGGGIADTASEKGAIEAIKRIKKTLSGEIKRPTSDAESGKQLPTTSGFKILGIE